MSGTDPCFCVLLAGPVTNNGRVQRTTRTLSELGEVTLVTSGGAAGDQALFNDRVHVIPTVRRALSGLRKWFLLHRQNDQLADAALASGRKFDLVWANDYSTLWPARRIVEATGARLVYDSHEIWLATVNQFFPDNVPLLKRLAFRVIIAICRVIGHRVEPRLAERADAIVTANRSFADVLQRQLHRPHIEVVLNTPELSPLIGSDRIRESLQLASGDRIVLYQGFMNAGRGLRELVQCAAHLPETIRLVMLGEGMLLEELRTSVAERDLGDRVLLPGPVPQAELHSWTASADLGVLILEPINLSKRLALANKIFEYMGAGIPILATDLPENRRIIDSCDCGWLISQWSPPQLASHIVAILDQPDEMRRRGENGRRWFEQRYNWGIESASVLRTVSPLLPAREEAHD